MKEIIYRPDPAILIERTEISKTDREKKGTVASIMLLVIKMLYTFEYACYQSFICCVPRLVCLNTVLTPEAA